MVRGLRSAIDAVGSGFIIDVGFTDLGLPADLLAECSGLQNTAYMEEHNATAHTPYTHRVQRTHAPESHSSSRVCQFPSAFFYVCRLYSDRVFLYYLIPYYFMRSHCSDVPRVSTMWRNTYNRLESWNNISKGKLGFLLLIMAFHYEKKKEQPRHSTDISNEHINEITPLTWPTSSKRESTSRKTIQSET